MAATRSSKQNKATTTTTNTCNGKKHSNSNKNDNRSPPPPKKKMTAEEKAQARARARASMCGGSVKDSMKDSSTNSKILATPDTTSTTVSTAKENKSNKKNNGHHHQGATATPPPHGGSHPETEETHSSTGKSSSLETTVEKENPKVDDTRNIKDDKEKASTTAPMVKQTSTAKKSNVVSVSSQLKGVAKLLLIDMQSDDAKQVDTAICNLFDMISAKNNDKPLLQRNNHFVLHHNNNNNNNNRALRYNNKNVQDADQLGAASILALVLRKWATNGTIQHNACGCIVIYANASPTARVALIKCGAIEAIVNGMMMKMMMIEEELRRPSSYALAALACLSKSSVVSGNPSLSWEELRQAWHPFISDYQGIDLIVQAMESLHDIPDAIADCADILENLIVHINNNEDVKSQVRKSGAHTLIFNAVQEYPDHVRVKSYGGALVKRFL